MFHKIKIPALTAIAVIATLWVGNNTYQYFSHSQQPHIFITGLQDKGHYKQTMLCTLCSDNGYKINHVSFSLDGQPYNAGINNQIGARTFEVPFTIDTSELTNGKHSLVVNAVDSSYNKNKSRSVWEFKVDNTPLQASFSNTEYSVHQGKTLYVTMQTNKPLDNATVKFLNKTYTCYPASIHTATNTYEAYIPIGCEEHPSEYMVVAQLSDSVQNEVTVSAKATIKDFTFKKQTTAINVSQEKLDEEKEMSMDAKILWNAVAKWTEQSPEEKLWNGPFEIPTQCKRISTPHGEVRVTSVRGRYHHNGIDIVNNPHSVVWAAQDGKVIIKDRFTMGGNTIVIDHGRGVTTVYMHLDDFADVEVGDMIKKGNPIGKLGKTGYAAGYHLHWELRVQNIPVDPLEWTKNIY